MRKLMVSLAAIALLSGIAHSDDDNTSEDAVVATGETQTDPNIWLEEVEGEDALGWVRGQNERSLAVLEGDARFAPMQAAAKEIVTSNDRIPYGSIRDGMVYNFWQDETNVRGLWRRTSLESYVSDAPDWETVVDFDALSKAENANWVFKGSNCFKPEASERTLCMVSLSNGGKDAVIQREFDLDKLAWVEGGFETFEAKQGVAWVDNDTLLIGTDWGADGSTLTESGYPSIVKRWTRGTPIEEAKTLVAGDKTDVGVWPFALELEDGRVLEGVG